MDRKRQLPQSHPQFPSDRLEAGRSHEGMARKSFYPQNLRAHLWSSVAQGIFLAAISAENLRCVDDFFIAPYFNGLVLTGKFTGKPHDLNGKIDGFRLRFSLKPIHWILNLSCLIYVSTGCPCPERRSWCTVSPSAHQQWPFQSLPCPGTPVTPVDESGITWNHATRLHQGLHVKHTTT